jgi:hypothetical protein
MTLEEKIMAICCHWYSYAQAADCPDRKDAGILKVVNDIADKLGFRLIFGAFDEEYRALRQKASDES